VNGWREWSTSSSGLLILCQRASGAQWIGDKWVPESVWTWWQGENSLTLQEIKAKSSSLYSVNLFTELFRINNVTILVHIDIKYMTQSRFYRLISEFFAFSLFLLRKYLVLWSPFRGIEFGLVNPSLKYSYDFISLGLCVCIRFRTFHLLASSELIPMLSTALLGLHTSSLALW